MWDTAIADLTVGNVFWIMVGWWTARIVLSLLIAVVRGS